VRGSRRYWRQALHISNGDLRGVGGDNDGWCGRLDTMASSTTDTPGDEQDMAKEQNDEEPLFDLPPAGGRRGGKACEKRRGTAGMAANRLHLRYLVCPPPRTATAAVRRNSLDDFLRLYASDATS